MRTHARATVTSAVVLVAVFVAGALVGRAWDRGRVAQASPAPDSASSEAPAQESRSRPMYEQVGLTAAQQVAIDSIVVHYRADVRALQQASREAWEKEYMLRVEEVREAIKSVMTEAQRAQYDSLLQASDERRRQRREERDTIGGSDGNDG